MNRFLRKDFLIHCYALIAFCLFSNIKGTTSNNYSQYLHAERENTCPQYQFRCESDNKCIDRSLICDGLQDCADQSDETEQLCSKIKCPSYSFRCNYGACINSAVTCDGRKDCIDGSDESDVQCPPFTGDLLPPGTCRRSSFHCTSGWCIDKNLICNGKNDCDDGTDEIIKTCENNQCSESQFRCGYGACIDLKFKCDGVKHCPDGSDELSRICKVPSTPPLTGSTQPPVIESTAPGSCTLPPASPDKKFTVQCPNGGNCYHRPGKKVPKYTTLSFTCGPGYQNDDTQPLVSICYDGIWLPPIPKCDKICKTLKPQNVDLVCYRKGKYVNCEGTLLAGTVVRPRCKSPHQEVYHRDITCQADGEWTNPLPTCAAN